MSVGTSLTVSDLEILSETGVTDSLTGNAWNLPESGLVVSEYLPGVPPAPWRFPARNRIVAGLALATVVGGLLYKVTNSSFIIIAAMLATLPAGLDGEIGTVGETGGIDFRTTTGNVMRESGAPEFVFYVFDNYLHRAPFADRYEELFAMKKAGKEVGKAPAAS